MQGFNDFLNDMCSKDKPTRPRPMMFMGVGALMDFHETQGIKKLEKLLREVTIQTTVDGAEFLRSLKLI